jgi:hypothetical protein
MAEPLPPPLEQAIDQLAQGFKAVGLAEVDPLKSPWAELERGVARLLGGAFDLQRPEHQALALGVAAALGKRLADEHGAFWFQHRESPTGISLGFPGALMVLSPMSAALDALSQANLGQLEQVNTEIRTALGRARLAPAGQAPMKLGPEEYEHLFDPALIQLVSVEPAKVKEALEKPAGELARTLREGLDRAKDLPQQVRQQIEAQLLGALSSLAPNKGIAEQIPQAGRMAELLVHLFGTTEATAPAPEEFWAEVVFPLLFIGAPTQFPPLEAEDKEALAQGADPLFLYLDLVPYQSPAPEDGLLGAFSAEAVKLLHPSLAPLVPLRLAGLDMAAVGPVLERYRPQEALEAFRRFVAYLKEQTGQAPRADSAEQVIGEAGKLVEDLKRLWAQRDKQQVAIRRSTGAEAASEPAITALRKALSGPRIILV